MVSIHRCHWRERLWILKISIGLQVMDTLTPSSDVPLLRAVQALGCFSKWAFPQMAGLLLASLEIPECQKGSRHGAKLPGQGNPSHPRDECFTSKGTPSASHTMARCHNHGTPVQMCLAESQHKTNHLEAFLILRNTHMGMCPNLHSPGATKHDGGFLSSAITVLPHPFNVAKSSRSRQQQPR